MLRYCYLNLSIFAVFLKNRNIISKIRRSKVTDYAALMRVENIAECSLGAFCNTFNLHLAIIGLEDQFWSSFEVAA